MSAPAFLNRNRMRTAEAGGNTKELCPDTPHKLFKKWCVPGPLPLQTGAVIAGRCVHTDEGANVKPTVGEDDVLRCLCKRLVTARSVARRFVGEHLSGLAIYQNGLAIPGSAVAHETDDKAEAQTARQGYQPLLNAVVNHARPVVIPEIERLGENHNGLAKQGRLTGLTQYLLQQLDRRILVGGIQVKKTRMSEVRHKLILSTGGSQLLAWTEPSKRDPPADVASWRVTRQPEVGPSGQVAEKRLIRGYAPVDTPLKSRWGKRYLTDAGRPPLVPRTPFVARFSRRSRTRLGAAALQ